MQPNTINYEVAPMAYKVRLKNGSFFSEDGNDLEGDIEFAVMAGQTFLAEAQAANLEYFAHDVFLADQKGIETGLDEVLAMRSGDQDALRMLDLS